MRRLHLAIFGQRHGNAREKTSKMSPAEQRPLAVLSRSTEMNPARFGPLSCWRNGLAHSKTVTISRKKRMPPRGRRLKPNHLKVIEGNPGKRKLIPPPKALPRKPRRPANLSKGAKREWDRVSMSSLGRLGSQEVVHQSS